jgi:solute carrier family 25 carnitine/acylcarnitine transporter 20/29
MGSQSPPLLPASAVSFLTDAVAGTVGGAAGVLVGSPLDLVKTRLQTQKASVGSPPSPPSLLHLLRAIVRDEGPRALFRGALAASLSQAPNNFVVFGTYGSALDFLVGMRGRGSGHSAAPAPPSPPPLPTYGELYMAGTFAGLLQSFALAPFEHIKVQQQIQQQGGGGPRSIREVVRSIVAARGSAGLFRGLVATAWRDAPTYGVYFASFELTKRTLLPTPAPTASAAAAAPPTPHWVALAGGAVAGLASWTLAIPVDVVKSRIQGAPLDAPRVTFVRAARAIYAESGSAGFVRGAAPLLLRAMPVNAVTFCGYEYALGRMTPYTQQVRASSSSSSEYGGS